MNQLSSFFQSLLNIIKLSSPMMLNQLINMASQFLCVSMVASYGTTALASTAVAFSIQIPIMMTTMALLSTTGILMSSAHAKANDDEVDNYLQQGWLISIVFSIMIIILFANVQYILREFGYSKTLINQVKLYFAAYNTGVICILLSSCNTQYGNSTHKSLKVLSVGILSVIILLASAYLFILKLNFQLAGLGYAIACQGIFYFTTTTLLFCKAKLLLPSTIQVLPRKINAILRLGMPVSLQIGIELLGFFCLTQIVAILGIEALASYQVINQYLLIATIPIIALSQACAITCAKSRVQIRNIALSALLFILTLTLLNAALSPLYSPWLITFFDYTNERVYLPKIINLLQLAAIFMIFDGVKNVFLGSLRGIADTFFSMLSSFLCTFFLTIPCSYFLAITCAWGLNGILIALIFGSIINIIALRLRWEFLSKLICTQTGELYAY